MAKNKTVLEINQSGGAVGGGSTSSSVVFSNLRHDALRNRNLPNQHPIDAITGLRELLTYAPTEFISQTDTPDSFSGSAGRHVLVNAAENALEFSRGYDDFWNGTFVESFNALVTSDGTVITMSIEQSGGGDLTMRFSDGETVLDCTPAATVTLTAGTDNDPQENYVYVLKSTKALTVSTTEWPTTEHIKVGYFFVPSATFVQTYGGTIINQNWNDHNMGTDGQGHLSHMTERIRRDGAYYLSGLEPNGVDQGAQSSYINYVNATTSYFKSTAGVIMQMHKHNAPAFDSLTDKILVVNWNGDSYHPINNIADVVADSTGASLANKYFNLFFFIVGNKGGEFAPIMMQLPDGGYTSETSAINDVSGYDNLIIPREFAIESSTGVAICRVTMRYSGGTTILSHVSTLDLRRSGGEAGGSGSGGSAVFADNQFTIYDANDVTRQVMFDAGTVTTGTTATFTLPAASGTLLTETTGDARYYLQTTLDPLFASIGDNIAGNADDIAANLVLINANTSSISNHIADVANPHSVTFAQLSDAPTMSNYLLRSGANDGAVDSIQEFIYGVQVNTIQERGPGGTGVTIDSMLVKDGGFTAEPTSPTIVPATIKLAASQSADAFRVTTSADTVLTVIDKDGNVGIGTDIPGEKLHVEGHLRVRDYLRLDTNVGGTVKWDVIVQSSDHLGIYDRVNTIYRLIVRGDTGHVGIGSIIPSYTLDVAGDINFTGTLYDSGVAVPLGLWSTNANGIHYSAGSVGIGTDTPDDKLHIKDDVNNCNIRLKTSKVNGIAVIKHMNDARQWNAGIGSSDQYYIQDVTAGLTRLYINTGGDVGIGTDNPGAPLDVDGGTANLIDVFRSSGSTAKIGVMDSLSTNTYSVAIGAAGNELTLHSGAGGAEAVRIDDSSNVGIGTDVPSDYWSQAYNLVVGDGANQGITVVSTNNGVLAFADTTIGNPGLDSGGAIIYNHADESMRFRVDGGELARLTTTGLGIGTDAPGATVEIVNSTINTAPQLRLSSYSTNAVSGDELVGGIEFWSNDNDEQGIAAEIRAAASTGKAHGVGDRPTDLIFSTVEDGAGTLTEHVRIIESGYVGINETSPDAQLHVKASGPTVVPQIIQLAASHSANAVEIWDSADVLKGAIDTVGYRLMLGEAFTGKAEGETYTLAIGQRIATTAATTVVHNIAVGYDIADSVAASVYRNIFAGHSMFNSTTENVYQNIATGAEIFDNVTGSVIGNIISGINIGVGATSTVQYNIITGNNLVDSATSLYYNMLIGVTSTSAATGTVRNNFIAGSSIADNATTLQYNLLNGYNIANASTGTVTYNNITGINVLNTVTGGISYVNVVGQNVFDNAAMGGISYANLIGNDIGANVAATTSYLNLVGYDIANVTANAPSYNNVVAYRFASDSTGDVIYNNIVGSNVASVTTGNVQYNNIVGSNVGLSVTANTITYNTITGSSIGTSATGNIYYNLLSGTAIANAITGAISGVVSVGYYNLYNTTNAVNLQRVIAMPWEALRESSATMLDDAIAIGYRAGYQNAYNSPALFGREATATVHNQVVIGSSFYTGGILLDGEVEIVENLLVSNTSDDIYPVTAYGNVMRLIAPDTSTTAYIRTQTAGVVGGASNDAGFQIHDGGSQNAAVFLARLNLGASNYTGIQAKADRDGNPIKLNFYTYDAGLTSRPAIRIYSGQTIGQSGGVAIGGTGGNSTQLTVTATGPTVTGQIIKGAASQSENLLELQDSNSAVLSAFNKDGYLRIGAATYNSEIAIHKNEDTFVEVNLDNESSGALSAALYGATSDVETFYAGALSSGHTQLTTNWQGQSVIWGESGMNMIGDHLGFWVGSFPTYTEVGRWTSTGLKVDTIDELTSSVGVTIENVLLKDGDIAIGQDNQLLFGSNPSTDPYFAVSASAFVFASPNKNVTFGSGTGDVQFEAGSDVTLTADDGDITLNSIDDAAGTNLKVVLRQDGLYLMSGASDTVVARIDNTGKLWLKFPDDIGQL